MRLRTFIIAAALVGTAALRAQAPAEAEYNRAMKALDNRQWEQAVADFNRLSATAKADAALYWKAYALNKLSRKAESLAAIAQLEKQYPKSGWVEDAKALKIELRQAAGEPVSPESEGGEDLKLMAINGLMHSDPERALPYLEKILQSGQPQKYKEQAMFVLAQSGSPRARQLLAEIARGGRNPELQAAAVRNLAMFGGAESRKTLAEIYRSAPDPKVKEAVLQGYMVTGDKAGLLGAAREEKSPEVRRAAIRQLGVMGAQDELWQMYQGESSPEVKKTILESMFVGGNTDRLIQVARTEKDPALRRAAIQSLSITGGQKSGAALLSLYASESDKAVRRQVLDGLFLHGDAKALIDIAKKETDPSLKRSAVEKLSIMNSKEARDYMMELLK